MYCMYAREQYKCPWIYCGCYIACYLTQICTNNVKLLKTINEKHIHIILGNCVFAVLMQITETTVSLILRIPT